MQKAGSEVINIDHSASAKMKVINCILLVFAVHVTFWSAGSAMLPPPETHLKGGSKTKVNVTTAVGKQKAKEALEKFQAELGPDNGSKPGPIFPGSRRINWDGGMVPFDMPGNFFRDNATRGSLVRVDGGEFRVSNPIMESDPGFGDNLFDTFNPDYPNQFQSLTPPRIFSPLSDNVFSQDFSVAGSPLNIGATIFAFGAVFVDVDKLGETWMEFYDLGGRSLGRVFVPPAPQDLTFIGVTFERPEVASMTFQLGNAVLGADDVFGKQDVVVLDDFVYSEPEPIITN